MNSGWRCRNAATCPSSSSGCKGAGGIHQLPARGQHSGCTVQNFCTQLSTLLHQRFTVLLTSHRLLAEHALAGTGCVHQHPVKKFRQRIRNAGRCFVQHHCIGHAHAFQIAFQDIRTSCNVFVAHQHTAALQCRRQLAAFAAGRGAHVQHTHPGLHAQQRCRRGRRRLLRVKHARMVVRMPPGPESSNHPADAPRMPPCKRAMLPVGNRLLRQTAPVSCAGPTPLRRAPPVPAGLHTGHRTGLPAERAPAVQNIPWAFCIPPVGCIKPPSAAKLGLVRGTPPRTENRKEIIHYGNRKPQQ